MKKSVFSRIVVGLTGVATAASVVGLAAVSSGGVIPPAQAVQAPATAVVPPAVTYTVVGDSLAADDDFYASTPPDLTKATNDSEVRKVIDSNQPFSTGFVNVSVLAGDSVDWYGVYALAQKQPNQATAGTGDGTAVYTPGAAGMYAPRKDYFGVVASEGDV
ncbi:MAG: hypothetical protein LBI33_10375, partial [Propionibacteriaceae bacterium]|nr:hypothetical protein [Propionibacteriaceae bacterium]